MKDAAGFTPGNNFFQINIPRQNVYSPNFAFIEMVARSRREIRQLVLARTVAAINSLCVTVGRVAMMLRWIFVMVQPVARCSVVTVAVVRMLPEAEEANFNSFAKAKEKLPAWAAAISSAGSVTEFSLRDAPEAQRVPCNTPLPVLATRVSPLGPTFHWTAAFRIISCIAIPCGGE